MRYIKFDKSKVQKKFLDAAEKAAIELEKLKSHQERKDFIDKKTKIWGNMKTDLSALSENKCWYSEAKEPQSGFDVDHFRPKKRAKRSDDEEDEGYPWLAFEVENYRISAIKSNRPNKNPTTGITEGKADWFRLLDGSPKACWDDRCCDKEQPMLLDPCKEEDVKLLTVDGDGRIVASKICMGRNKLRVDESITRYGLNLDGIITERKRIIRQVTSLLESFEKLAEIDIKKSGEVSEQLANNFENDLLALANFEAPYSRAAKAEIIRKGYFEIFKDQI